MQKLGNFDSGDAALWAGVATGGAGLAMFISAPFWGMLADRWGRKPMLLRAQFGGAVVVALYIFVPNVFVFLGFRVLQGLFTGTVSAASALVATNTPRDKLPLTMGTLLGAIYAGFTLGPLAGGFLADNFGFSVTFAITSLLLLCGGLVILFFASENFQRPAPAQRTSLNSMMKLAFSREIFPLLLVVSVLNLGPQIVQPILPLIIGQISPTGDAASYSGLALGLNGIVAAVSAFAIGRFGRGIPVRNILIVCCVGTGILYLGPFWASSITQLILFIGLTGLLSGGIVTSANSLVGLSVPVAQQGIAYGLSQSANSLGSGVGPFIGGGLAPVIGLRPIFLVTAGVFLLVGLVSMKLLPAKPASAPAK